MIQAYRARCSRCGRRDWSAAASTQRPGTKLWPTTIWNGVRHWRSARTIPDGLMVRVYCRDCLGMKARRQVA